MSSATNRVALVIALTSAWVLSLPAAADEYDPTLGWQTRRGALICGSYFAINDGEAAARKGDEKWLKEVDCLVVNGGLKLTVIQEAPFASDTDIWRARLHPPNRGQDVTIYLRAYNAVNFAHGATFKTEAEAKNAFAAMVKSYENGKLLKANVEFHFVNNRLMIGPGPYGHLAYFCQKAQREGADCEYPRPDTDQALEPGIRRGMQNPPKTEPKNADPGGFDKLLRHLEEKKPEPAAFDSLLKNLTRQQVEEAPPARPR